MPRPQRHAITRALERYDITLTPRELDKLSEEIRAGRWLLSRTLSDGKHLFAVVVRDKPALALCDPASYHICTFFQSDWTISAGLRKKKKKTRFGPKWRALDDGENEE